MDQPSLRFDGFELDLARYELRTGGERVAVEPRAFDLLRHLILHRDRVVTKDELLDALWGDRFVGEAALTTALRTARIAVGDNGKEQRLIRTVLRRGYQFVGTVSEATSGVGSTRDSRVPLPVRLATLSGLGFAGRVDERSALAKACKEVAASGQRQFVLVSGEAGIGKTALCSVVAGEAHENGATVLYGRCDDELAVPYQPWREVLVGLERDVPDIVERFRDALAPILGGVTPGISDSESARFALFSAVADVLEAAADGGLALVVLDDVHWADTQTISLLRHLLQRSLTVPVLLIATFRDSDIEPSHPLNELSAAAHREPGTTRLVLDRLGDGDLLALLEIVAGHEMDRNGIALRDSLMAETDGNAFFVTESLRHLAETGAIDQDEHGRWVAPADVEEHGLPISVREVVSRRVERLGVDTRRALDLASIIGRDFELELLAALLDESPVRTYERLVPAVDNALVTDDSGRFEFAHAIVGRTLYEELRPTSRALGHEAAAVALERLAGEGRGDRGDLASEIARHWMRSIGPESQVKAAEYAARAGDEALAHLAPASAVSWYRNALDLLPDGDERRCVVLVGLGTAQRQSGDTDYRATLLNASRLASELGEDELLVRAVLANNRGEVSEVGAVDDERVEMLRAAIDVCTDGRNSAMLHAILSIEMQHGPDVDAVAARSLELARATDDDRTMARVVRLAESALRIPDALQRREQWVREGIGAADRTGDPQLRGMLSMSLHELALERGDRATMDRERRIRAEFAARSPEPFVRWTNEQTSATHRFLDGDLDGAEAAAAIGLDVGVASGQPEAFVGYAGLVFQIRRAQDRLAEIADELASVHEEDPSLQVFRAALAHAWSELGRESDARSLVDGLDVSQGAAPQFWSTAMMLWAETCHRLALPAEASRLVPILDAWGDQVASTGATSEGAIAHGLGRALATLGRIEEAREAYDVALAVNQRLRAPLFVARTQLAQAELFADTEPDRARAIAVDARAAVEHLGFARVDRLLGELLQRLA